jgi:hypothetical protein
MLHRTTPQLGFLFQSEKILVQDGERLDRKRVVAVIPALDNACVLARSPGAL